MRKAIFVEAFVLLILPFLCCEPAYSLADADLADGTVQRYTVVVASSKGRCSGVVLAQDVVLTAAHCVQAASGLQVGGNIGGGYQTYPPFALSPVLETVQHPLYVSGDAATPDLAIIKLATPLPYRFIPAFLEARAVSVGDNLIAAGYGISAANDVRAGVTLRMVLLRVDHTYKDQLDLTGLQGHYSGSCGGDSGGPLLTYRGLHALVGIMVRGGCTSRTEAVALAPHYEWIKETVQKLSAP